MENKLKSYDRDLNDYLYDRRSITADDFVKIELKNVASNVSFALDHVQDIKWEAFFEDVRGSLDMIEKWLNNEELEY
jgi:hypothetical protein